MKRSTAKKRKPVVLTPGAGRSYPMGRIWSVFKADGAETGETYSISEWWLEPDTKGPPPHQHEDDHAWYVIAGKMAVLIGRRWTELEQGGFVVIPGGTRHTFENRSRTKRAGILSFNNMAGFEEDMPGISKWFIANPPGKAVSR
jgi:mannose-6-phosphate isomerase-like protein (cupin superfamily)